jgi:hypothetical protein
MDIGILHSCIQAVCPIVGVSVGDPADKATWRVDFADTATDTQKAAAVAAVAAYNPDAPTSEQVDAERNRRLLTVTFNTKVYQFCDDQGSEVNITGAGSLASVAIMSGAQPGNLRWYDANIDFAWIAADNSLVTMDAQTMLAFAKAAADWKAKHIWAARVLKSTSPIPSDYATNPSYWP